MDGKIKFEDQVYWCHDRMQKVLFALSLFWRCHQLPKRSLQIRGRQMPICARCTGILIGLIVAPLFLGGVSDWLMILLLMLFLADSISQAIGMRESTNAVRLWG